MSALYLLVHWLMAFLVLMLFDICLISTTIACTCIIRPYVFNTMFPVHMPPENLLAVIIFPFLNCLSLFLLFVISSQKFVKIHQRYQYFWALFNNCITLLSLFKICCTLLILQEYFGKTKMVISMICSDLLSLQ